MLVKFVDVKVKTHIIKPDIAARSKTGNCANFKAGASRSSGMDSNFSRRELKHILENFTNSAVIDKPDDIINYAISYFTRLKNDRDSTMSPNIMGLNELPKIDEDLEEQAAASPWIRKGRRASVSAENYDPEEDSLSDIERYPKTTEQRQKIMDSLQYVFLFRCQDDTQRQTMVDALMPRQVAIDEVIITQGDEGDFFYLIDSGTFQAVITDPDGKSQVVADYDNNGFFGELALMYNEPRAATVRALTDGFLWALSGQNFRRLAQRSAYEKRQRYEILLKKVKQLRPLNSYERNIVSDALEPRVFAPNDVIFHQGDNADGMYFIEEGEVVISVANNQVKEEEEEICRLSVGGYFGELALVTNLPRAATATSVTLSKLAFLDVQAFERLLGPCMDLLHSHIKYYDQLCTTSS